ncbi:bifunctional oligoribonuclease/PAP phosphatase NrnA [Bacillus mexicanus]|uniref:DHH family phosphoesterase n=1 Tax=Bacillus mexicanus TaxID=2834415 RepID=UPI003D1C7B6C
MNIQQEILNKINEYNNIVIHRHINPDPDALGSQGGLQKIIQSSFPNKKVYVVGEEVEGLTFLNKMDKQTVDIYKDALVIVCDTADTVRISYGEMIPEDSFIIKIDHHPDREPYGDLSWVDTKYSSTSEMLSALYLEYSDSLTMTNSAARLLYAGIIGDTGRFLYNNTSHLTLEIASELLTYDFDPQEIYTNLYKTSRDIAKLKGKVLTDFEVTDKGVAYFKMTRDVLSAFNVNEISAANLVNTLKDIEGNEIWVFFVEYANGEIRVRIRSASTPINDVAYQFNGGGHPLASGATVNSWSEATHLIESLNDLLN